MAKVGVKWSENEKPEVNHWYKVIEDDDYWKIVKDFYSKERNITFIALLNITTQIVYTLEERWHSAGRLSATTVIGW